MRDSRPLPEVHPELLVIETPGLGREYRVENGPCSQRGRVASRFPWITGFDALAVMVFGLLWTPVRHSFNDLQLSESISLDQMKGNAVLTIGTGIGLALLAYQKATRVLWGAS
jgi:hypothetical protein